MISLASRETAYAKLFALFVGLQAAGLPIFKTTTRRLKHWADVTGNDQPALFLEHSGETYQPVRGQPPRIVLESNLWIYVRTDGDPTGPILNPLLDAIDKAMQPSNDGDHALTLDGVVHHCWIEGQVQIFEGDLGNEAVAIVPVKMLVT